MIKHILFDLGNVITVAKPTIMEDILDSMAVNNHEELKRLYFETIQLPLFKGLITSSDFIHTIIEKKLSNEGYDLLYKQWSMGYPSLMESLNQDLIKLIDNLRHNYEISLLSDTLDVHIEYFSNVGLFSHFDHTFLSPILGISKHEGTSIYKSIAKTLTVNPNFILFIDDLPKNVSNAKMIGWKSIQYLNNEHLIKELASYGIKS